VSIKSGEAQIIGNPIKTIDEAIDHLKGFKSDFINEYGLSQSQYSDIQNRLNNIEDKIQDKHRHDKIIEISNIVVAAAGILTAGTSIYEVVTDKKNSASKYKSEQNSDGRDNESKSDKRSLNNADIKLSVKYEVYKKEIILSPEQGYKWYYKLLFKEDGYSEIKLIKEHGLLYSDKLFGGVVDKNKHDINVVIPKKGTYTYESSASLWGPKDYHRRGWIKIIFGGFDTFGNTIVFECPKIYLR
jgi:hypothetical protein